MAPPNSITHSRYVVRKSLTKARPKRAIAENMISEIAAPMPVANPDHFPLLSVLWIQRIPIGPNGIDAPNPTIIPFISSSIINCHHNKDKDIIKPTGNKEECKETIKQIKLNNQYNSTWEQPDATWLDAKTEQDKEKYRYYIIECQ